MSKIETGEITRAVNILTSEIKGDVDALKGYFDGVQMLDLSGKGPTEVANKIESITSDWQSAGSLRSSIVEAAININNVPED